MRPFHVAIVGSGPSGFFAAASLLKAADASDEVNVAVDMLEMLPTPWGLVRSGVAPDHPKIKSISKQFEKTAEDPRFRFFGNVVVGEHVEVLDPLTATFDPTPLAEVLADPAIEIVLHAGRQDVAILRREWKTTFTNVFDTQVAAGFAGFSAQAGYNVSPPQVGAYFAKINCFCFTQQTMKPGETREMTVVFYVDPSLVKDHDQDGLNTITLSYTFYRIPNPEKPVAEVPTANPTSKKL